MCGRNTAKRGMSDIGREERQIENGMVTKGALTTKSSGVQWDAVWVHRMPRPPLSLFSSHIVMILWPLYPPFYRFWHSMSHGVVMASPQKRSFNNLTVSPMYTITGVRVVCGGREIKPRSVHHRNAHRRQCSHNEQILWTRSRERRGRRKGGWRF